jgi:tRNA dimethylallyltransferase
MVKPPLVVIAGPTASGKSAVALARAEAEGGIIINADASQLYRDIPILSAQPDESDRARVPHRLYGVRDGACPCSAAEWAAMAATEVRACWAAGLVPMLVGGTGLYLKTLIEGIAPVPPVPAELRAAVRVMPAENVRRLLEAEDPAMAVRLHPNDPQRNARALEVWRATGRSLADLQAARAGGIGEEASVEAILIMPDREETAARIDRRIAAMWEAGALEEVRALAARGLSPDLPVMRAIGVPPLLELLTDRLAVEDALARWRLDTRRYAKRQRTFFANQFPGWPRWPG